MEMKNIAEIRKKMGVTQNEVANAIGMLKSNYASMERGALVPKSIEDKKYQILTFLYARAKEQHGLIQLIEGKLKELSCRK